MGSAETLVWSEVKMEADALAFPRLSQTSTSVGSYLFVIGGHDGVDFSNHINLLNLGSSFALSPRAPANSSSQ